MTALQWYIEKQAKERAEAQQAADELKCSPELARRLLDLEELVDRIRIEVLGLIPEGVDHDL